MCVVTLVEKVRPTDEQIAQMWDQNPKGGGGVAWRDIEAGTPVVRWRKGLDRADMLELNKTLPFPYILHFRQPSADTSDSLLACHPFQIDADATIGFEGSTPGYVLFHNGHWTDWRKKLEAICIAGFGLPGFRGLPSGAWSDSRGLAWAAHYLNFGFLEMVNEKVMCFGPNEGDIEQFGGPWLSVKVPGSDKSIIVSNTSWTSQRPAGFTTQDKRNDTSKLLTAASESQTGKAGGTSQQTPFRAAQVGTGEAAGRERNQQKSVQEAHESAVSGHVGSREERGVGALNDGTKKLCSGCPKVTSAGNIILGKWFCFQCWDRHPNKYSENPVERIISAKLWVGICERCRANSSGMKTVLGDQWLCMACWETNSRPKIYFARERGQAA